MAYSITGKSMYAQLGEWVKAYDPALKEQKVELEVDATGIEVLTAIGLAPKIKTEDSKGNKRPAYIVFIRNELKKGTEVKNKPIPVYDTLGQVWPTDKKIGNGSVLKIKFNTFETKWNKKTFIKPAILEVTVVSWIEYIPPVKAVEPEATATKETWGTPQ